MAGNSSPLPWRNTRGLETCKVRAEPRRVACEDCPLCGGAAVEAGSGGEPRAYLAGWSAAFCLPPSCCCASWAQGQCWERSEQHVQHPMQRVEGSKFSVFSGAPGKWELWGWPEEPPTLRLTCLHKEGRAKAVQKPMALKGEKGACDFPVLPTCAWRWWCSECFLCAKHFSKRRKMLSRLISITTLWGKYYPHLANDKPEYKRGDTTSPRSHS